MGDLLGSPRVAPLSFLVGLIAYGGPARSPRLVCTPLFFFAHLLLGTSFTSAKHGRYVVGSVSPRPETISFWALKRRGELETRGRPLGLHLSGVKVHGGCIRILYKNLTRLW